MAEDPHAAAKQSHARATAVALLAIYESARADALAGVNAGMFRDLVADRWAYRVADVIEDALKRIAAVTGQATFDDLNGSGAFDPTRMDAYLEVGAIERGRGWVATANEALNQLDAFVEDFYAEVERTMDSFVKAAAEDAENIAEAGGNFGAREAAEAAGALTKTWRVGSSGNHRASHVALDGTTVGMDERFTNGLPYPHAPGPPAETVNCNCFLTFGGA